MSSLTVFSSSTTYSLLRQQPTPPLHNRQVAPFRLPTNHSPVSTCRLTRRRRTNSVVSSSGSLAELEFPACELTRGAFKQFGQVLSAIEDSAIFGQDDAQLTFKAGEIPRFYIMQLPNKGMQFRRVTRHVKVTQCLGGLGPKPWYIAVAPPEIDEPTVHDVTCFEVPAGSFIKLEAGTWHAGPLFDDEDAQAKRDFYNLECSDTNLSDATHVYFSRAGVIR